MEKQKLVNRTRSYAATLAAGEVSSLRINDDEKNVLRCYSGGFIGIAGRIGEGDDAALEKEACAALEQGIPYPSPLFGGDERREDFSREIIAEKDFLGAVKHLAARLKKSFPDFIFSDKIILENSSSEYKDSAGTDYSFFCSSFSLGLMIKSVSSANIMDLAYGAKRNYYDEDAIVSDISALLDVYSAKLPMPEEKLPVIIDLSAVSYMLGDMTAEMYSGGAGIFAGRLGQKVFRDDVNILINRTPGKNPSVCFFDDEGVTLPGDKFYFVKDGVLSGLATYRRTAAEFNMPLSGCGYAEFDGVPVCSNFRGLEVGTGGKKLSEVLKRGIYVSVTSGGDMTPDGNIAMPVMLAYLYEDGKLVGTLPEFGISGNVFDILGKDFVAAAKNDVFGFNDEDVIISYFNIDAK